MPLEETTLTLIKETFDGQKCCKCKEPATRMARRKFYCAHHYPVPRQSSVELMKTHRHPSFTKG